MKKRKKLILKYLISIIMILLFIAISVIETMAAEERIESEIVEELLNAKIPNAAITTFKEHQPSYLLYSKSDNEKCIDENTLFQIGSLSKAFTALGILFLEDEGLLSLDDPISYYLPWFKVSYDGQVVPSQDLTIKNVLYQTSGFTNDENKYPNAREGMSLEDSVQCINGSELMFYPSQKFSYSNTNYRILGLIIEVVSEQSYDVFMKEKILRTLGLENTFTNLLEVQNKGTVISGTRLSFFRSWNYDISPVQANVPAGYIYSNITDMNHWLQIQSGKAEVPKQFQRIIEKSHQPIADCADGNHYAAGWFIKDETGEIFHSGGTPNYSAYIVIDSNNDCAVSILTNINLSMNTNNIGQNTLNLLSGKPILSYAIDIWTIFDWIFSCITIGSIIGIFVCIVTLIRRLQQISKGQYDGLYSFKKRFIFDCLAIITSLGTLVCMIVIPMVFAASWASIAIWAPLSVIIGIISLVLLSVLLLCLLVLNHKIIRVVKCA